MRSELITHVPQLRESTRELMDFYRAGKIKPHISDRRPLAEAPQALASVAEGRSSGKVVILPGA